MGLEKNHGLTWKQEKFARYYVKSGNGTWAAIQAGYRPNAAHVTASRNLRKAKVADRIDEIKKLALDVNELTEEFVLKGLAKEAAEGDTPGARVRALELIGKHRGMFVEKTEDVTPVQKLSDLELTRLLRSLEPAETTETLQ